MHSGPSNQQIHQKHEECNSGGRHRKLPSSYSTYSTRRTILPHHQFHQETATRKFPVHRNSSWGGALRHLGIIVLIAAYATVAPAHPWVNPESPGWGPSKIDGGTAAQLAAEHHRWEEFVLIFITLNTVEKALENKL
jgi:hypothetical protein